MKIWGTTTKKLLPRLPLFTLPLWFFLTWALTFSSVQLLSHVLLFTTPWTTARQVSLSITKSWSPPKPMSIESMMPSNHLILCRPLLLLPSIFTSIRVFSNESTLCYRWLKYWSFSFNISPSNEQPRLISLRMDWLDLLAVQGTLKSLLQHHSLKASILRRSAFFMGPALTSVPDDWKCHCDLPPMLWGFTESPSCFFNRVPKPSWPLSHLPALPPYPSSASDLSTLDPR